MCETYKLMKHAGVSKYLVAMQLTRNQTIRKYNHMFRNVDKPTDILAIPLTEVCAAKYCSPRVAIHSNPENAQCGAADKGWSTAETSSGTLPSGRNDPIVGVY
jgi:ssRNA-specific RNase YbeY (16S rRNA maturation enzyme)